MLGSPILYLEGMRILMFQLSGFYYKSLGFRVKDGLGLGDIKVLIGLTGFCAGPLHGSSGAV